MNKLPDYTAEQMHYIDSVGGNAHITAIAIIGVLESQINTTRAQLIAETARTNELQAKLITLAEIWENTLDHGCAATFFEAADDLRKVLDGNP